MQEKLRDPVSQLSRLCSRGGKEEGQWIHSDRTAPPPKCVPSKHGMDPSSQEHVPLSTQSGKGSLSAPLDRNVVLLDASLKCELVLRDERL